MIQNAKTFYTSLSIRVPYYEQPMTHTRKYCTKQGYHNFYTYLRYVAAHIENDMTHKTDKLYGIETYARDELEKTEWARSQKKIVETNT